MSGRIVQGWSCVIGTALPVLALATLTGSVQAGHHKHETSYDVVQGYIVQAQSAPAQPTPTPAPQAQATPSAQSVGFPAAQSPAPSQPAPAQFQIAPQAAPTQTMSFQFVQQPAPVQTFQVVTAPAPGPAPVQVFQFAAAPAPATVQTVQLASAPVQQVPLMTTQVQYVQVPAVASQVVGLAPQVQSVAATGAVVATPVQILIPHQKKCHHHLFCNCK